MSLLGTPVLVLSGLLAVLLPVACLLLWNRIRGPRPVRVGARLGLVVGAQLSALLLAGLAVNDYGTFYASWSELVGTLTGGGAGSQPAIRSHYGAAEQALQARPTVVPDAVRGALVSTTLHGVRTGLEDDAEVYLPPQYFAGGPGAHRLPVVEVIGGYPGHPASLVGKLHLPDALLEAIRAGRARPMVLVMTSSSPLFPWDTECVDVPGGPQVLTFLADDVPADLARQFGLRPTEFAAIGESTGGYCAIKLAMTHPGRFGAAAGLSPYYRAATDRTTRGIFAHRPQLLHAADLLWRLRHLPAPPVAVLVADSAQERGSEGAEAARGFLDLVTAPMSADEHRLQRGGHNFDAWVRQVPYVLSWLSRHLAPAADGGSSAAPAPPAPASGSGFIPG